MAGEIPAKVLSPKIHGRSHEPNNYIDMGPQLHKRPRALVGLLSLLVESPPRAEQQELHNAAANQKPSLSPKLASNEARADHPMMIPNLARFKIRAKHCPKSLGYEEGFPSPIHMAAACRGAICLPGERHAWSHRTQRHSLSSFKWQLPGCNQPKRW